MQTSLLEITFGKSTSVHYDHAVHLAQRLAGYRLTGTLAQVVHTVAWTGSLADEATWEPLDQLLRLVSGWRSARITLAGKPVHYWTLAAGLNQIRACHARKVQQGTGDGYCSGKTMTGDEATYFGCRWCKGVSRRVAAPSYPEDSWIQLGTLTPQRDAFRVSKEAIFTTLQQQTRTQPCVLCPAFDWQRVRAGVDDLPDVIELGGDSKFEVRYAAIDPKQALGIKLKQAGYPGAGGPPAATTGPGRPTEPAPLRQVPQVRYSDIAGQDAALQAIQNVVQLPLTHAAYFAALGVEPQNGIILYGPPGNGKTLLAKAVATECQAHFELISGPEILSRWVGQSEHNLRRVFERARQLAPSVVLIDELDSIAPRRDLLNEQHQVQLLAQLLVLLDGLETRGRVAVIATTNRLKALDPAVARPGRFDYHVEVPCPDRAGRAAILQVCLAKLKTRRPMRVETLAAATEGFSGAELAALCREAGLHAIHRGIARGLTAPRLALACQDLKQALKTLRAKRVPEQALTGP